MKAAMRAGAKVYKSKSKKTAVKTKKKGGRKKKVKFEKEDKYDDYTGGAIEKGVRFSEVVAPEPKQDYTLMDAGDFLTEGPKWEYFRDAYDYRPLNVQPMHAYESLLQARDETILHNRMLEGLTGLGAAKDDEHTRTATVHTLKRHPELLNIYLAGRV